MVLCLLKIVKTSRTSRRGQGSRQNLRSARAAPLGTTRTTAAKNAARKAAAAPARAVIPQQTAEKIMVSGLPTDVNEQQIKVVYSFLMELNVVLTQSSSFRNFSQQPSDLSGIASCTSRPRASGTGPQQSCSRAKATVARLTIPTTTDSSTAVSNLTPSHLPTSPYRIWSPISFLSSPYCWHCHDQDLEALLFSTHTITTISFKNTVSFPTAR